MPQKTVRREHVPQRTCVGCRMVNPKRTLVRIVRQPDGIKIDPTGKQAGRGAYLHNQRSCWDRALKGPLAGALKAEISAEDREMLLAYAETLTEDDRMAEAEDIG